MLVLIERNKRASKLSFHVDLYGVGAKGRKGPRGNCTRSSSDSHVY